jgi:hypothetical protein
MANASFNLTTLDFDEIKSNLKSFMVSKPQFNDVNFEGSNINVLLDVLSYNTYLNSFYLNMVASEMFLDSAQLRSSVLSHAKSLNYVPRSNRSARALVNITITPTSNTSSVEIPFGTEFSSRVGSNTYVFTTNQDIIITSETGVFSINGLPVYEGAYSEDVFVVDSANLTQRYILTNKDIDTTSLKVIVSENSGSNLYNYEVRSSLFDVSSDTAVCFLQPTDNDQYEIVFGTGIAGRPPSDNALVFALYRVSNADLPNGASVFVPTGAIDGHSNLVVATALSATDGETRESIESIKFNAPRYYQTQERAVTANDYRVLMEAAFPEITAINVYGGEDADPPRYGTVVISLAVAGSSTIPENKKVEYTEYIRRRASVSSEPIFVEPAYLKIDIDILARYNTGSTVLSPLDIEERIRTAILNYNNTELNNFGVTLRYSRLVSVIDGADDSIISNDLYVKPYIAFNPSLNTTSNYVFKYYNEFIRMPYSDRVHIYEDEHTISSTPFLFQGNLCTVEDDGLGKLRFVQVSGSNHLVIRNNVGTVDYTNGVVELINFLPSSYIGNEIKIYALPLQKDITASRNQILRIQNTDISINVLTERIL